MQKKSWQVELWQECNSLCDFCYLGKSNRNMPDNLKIKVLEKTLAQIKQLQLDSGEYDTIAFIGGEFFQGQLKNADVRGLFFEVMHETHKLLLLGNIHTLWLTATLTRGNQEDLYATLDIFEDIKVSKDKNSGVWLCTSYDTKGRFHNTDMEES